LSLIEYCSLGRYVLSPVIPGLPDGKLGYIFKGRETVNFMAIRCIYVLITWYIFLFWYVCTNKNLATLVVAYINRKFNSTVTE
jgi:hypothetical protein